MEVAYTDQLLERLRFSTSDRFRVPSELAGCAHRERLAIAAHIDHYFDAASAEADEILATAGCALRLRARADGTTSIAFKRNLENGPCGEIRQRAIVIEHCAIELPAGSAPVIAAQQIVGEHPLRRVCVVRAHRNLSSFAGRRGELTLCEDELRYPDGSSERSIEVTLEKGPGELLELARFELVFRNSKLSPVSHGKRSEANRRRRRIQPDARPA